MSESFNLWRYFPDWLLEFDGILLLPVLAVPLYLYLFYALIAYKAERFSLLAFLLMSAIASLVMLKSMGPGIGLFVPPMLLLAVALLPVGLILKQFFARSRSGMKIWAVATLAGLIHGLSWGVWLFALARS